MAKKYIQACNLSGSIYGKDKDSEKKAHFAKKNLETKENLLDEYDSFYRKQVDAMTRMFRR
ncbi:MAG: hypothetical protein KAI70_04470 [Candidatus Omnitrophica bacterium]|nr:hypothetical protein [Candidatus Omnitrophota bacterium]